MGEGARRSRRWPLAERAGAPAPTSPSEPATLRACAAKNRGAWHDSPQDACARLDGRDCAGAARLEGGVARAGGPYRVGRRPWLIDLERGMTSVVTINQLRRGTVVPASDTCGVEAPVRPRAAYPGRQFARELGGSLAARTTTNSSLPPRRRAGARRHLRVSTAVNLVRVGRVPLACSGGEPWRVGGARAVHARS